MSDDPTKKNIGDDQNNVEDKTVLNSDDTSYDQKTGVIPPGVADEESISGSTPDTESIQNEDLLQHSNDVGLQQGEDDEHPQEIDIARDVDNAEKSIKDH